MSRMNDLAILAQELGIDLSRPPEDIIPLLLDEIRRMRHAAKCRYCGNKVA